MTNSPKHRGWQRVIVRKGKQRKTTQFCEENCSRYEWHNAGRYFFFKDIEVAVLFKMTFLDLIDE